MKGSPCDENVDTERCDIDIVLDTDLELTLAFERVRKGFSELPKWLSVLPIPAAAPCKGAMPGRAVGTGFVVYSVRSSVSSGGVRKGIFGRLLNYHRYGVVR